MKELLITVLQSFGYPVFLQGTLAKDEPYPPSFFTFWNGASGDGNHYDDRPASCIWEFDVNFYSNDPALTNSIPLTAITLLKNNGFTIGGKGYDIPTDEPTHTGRGFTALFLEYTGG